MRIAGVVLSVALALSAAAEGRRFGKPLQGLPPSSLDEVLAEPENGRRVRLEGTIERVCEKRGCWLELKEGSRSVHVTFEGYSFFVPRDSAGRAVVLEGRVLVKQPAAGDVAHKKSEGAAAAGSRVTIEAAGVEIR
jgi:hypothetical protein